MSGKAGSVASIVIGAVMIVATVLYPPAAAAAAPVWASFLGRIAIGAVMIGGGIAGMLSKVAKQSDAQALELQIATASTGIPVPVVFGEARVTPNFYRVAPNLFSKDAVSSSGGGGKGGGGGSSSQTVGYNYYLRWEQRLCMGSLDAVGMVYGMPGETEMIDAEDPWVEFGSADYVDLTLAPVDGEELSDGFEQQGGQIRVYRGAKDQVRVATGDNYQATGIPYRNVSFAIMGIGGQKGFCLGQTNAPLTYQFKVRRLPVCLRDDGTEVPGLITRGSTDTGHPNYHMANPAAIYWEAMRNDLWGLGRPASALDEESFVAVSEIYAGLNIGLGLVLDAKTTIEEFFDALRLHCKCICVNDGETYKLQSLLDMTTTHGEMLTLRSKDLINFTPSCPTWQSGVPNEVRVEFTSSERSDRPDVTLIQGLAAVQIIGQIQTQTIQLPGFYNHSTAQQQATRLLCETGFPYKSFQWEMNRFSQRIGIGQVVRVVWDRLPGQTVTLYCQVTKITDGASDSENIVVEAIEDTLLPAVNGEDLSTELPTVWPWERIVEIPSDEIYRVDDVADIYLVNGLVWEVPALLVKGEREVIVAVTSRGSNKDTGCRVYWSDDEEDWQFMAYWAFKAGKLADQKQGVVQITMFAVPGTMTTGLAGNVGIDRGDGFEFSVEEPDLFAADLLGCNAVSEHTDDITALMGAMIHILIIDEEMMQCGLITQTGTNTFRAQNILRGRFGTLARDHAAGTVVHYLSILNTAARSDDVDQGKEVFFLLDPTDSSLDPIEGQLFHYGADNKQYVALSRRPLPPSLLSWSEDGGVVTLTMRARVMTGSAETEKFYVVCSTSVRSIGDIGFAIQQLDADGNELFALPDPVDHTFTRGQLDTGHRVTIDVTLQAGAKVLRVHSVLHSRISYLYTEVAIG